jgi:hypothetical protein
VTRLTAWLKARGCRNSAGVALKAIEAAKAQDTVLPCQSVGACQAHSHDGQIPTSAPLR